MQPCNKRFLPIDPALRLYELPGERKTLVFVGRTINVLHESAIVANHSIFMASGHRDVFKLINILTLFMHDPSYDRSVLEKREASSTKGTWKQIQMTSIDTDGYRIYFFLQRTTSYWKEMNVWTLMSPAAQGHWVISSIFSQHSKLAWRIRVRSLKSYKPKSLTLCLV